jgi:transposase
MDLREICHELGVSVRTVYRYKDLAEHPPCRAYKTRARVLDPYVPYLVRHWNEGCHNGERLYGEVREQGYAHCHTNVTSLLAEFRCADAAGKPLSSIPRARKGAVAGTHPSARNVAALFIRRKEKLTEEQEAYLEELKACEVAIADATASRKSSRRWSEGSKAKSSTGGYGKPKLPRPR